MEVRRFDINIHCSSCKSKIEKKIKKFNDIKIEINVLEQLVNVYADESKYSDEDIIKIFNELGYSSSRI